MLGQAIYVSCIAYFRLGGANGEHTRTCGTKAQEVNCNENAEAGVCACDSEDLCNSKSMAR